jgi:chromosome segregation ATPase
MIASLKSELEAVKVERDRLQTLWLDSQKELVAEQNKIKKLANENESLNTRLGIAEGVKTKIESGFEVIKDESFEHKKEAAKLYNELQKLQPVIQELQEKNKLLEHQLHEATLKLGESNINHQTTKQLLRTEIRRLSQDRSTLRQEMAQQDKSVMHVEKDKQLYKEMIEKLKSERYELQRQVYDLKRRADDAERKYFDAKLKSRQNEKTEMKKMIQKSLNAAQVEVGRRFDSGQPLQQISTAQEESKKALERKMQELPDFESWRLKLETLSNEKDFLMNENSMLKKKVTEVLCSNQITRTIRQLEESLRNSQAEVKQQETTQKEHQEKVATLDARYLRAKKVAAHIEKQLKVSIIDIGTQTKCKD